MLKMGKVLAISIAPQKRENKIKTTKWVCGGILVIPALGWQSQDCYKFEVRQVYAASSRPACVQKRPVLNHEAQHTHN